LCQVRIRTPARCVMCGKPARQDGYLHQDITPEALVAAVGTAANGASLWTVEQLARIRQWQEDVGRKWETLTRREREVLKLIVSACSNGEIAAALGITRKTVEFHVSDILCKLGVSSRLAAATWVKEAGFDIEMDEPRENPGSERGVFPR